jgi:hypothetical protein
MFMNTAGMGQMRPQIILLRDGTDTSQGKGQLISNINACQAVAEAVRTTLGPRGMDKLIVSEGGKVRSRLLGIFVMNAVEWALVGRMGCFTVVGGHTAATSSTASH